VTGAIALLEELVVQGRDLNQFVIDFTWYLRNLMLVKSDTNMEDVLEVSSEHMALLREEAKMADDETLMRFVRIFSELSNQIRYSSQKRVLIEIALVKLCRPQMEQDYSAIVDRLNVMEDKLEKGVPVLQQPGSVGSGAAADVPQKKKIPTALPEEVEKLCRNWKQVQSAATGLLRQALMTGFPTVTERGEIMLVYDEPEGSKSIHSSLLADEAVMEDLQNLIIEQVGKSVPVVVQVNKTGAPGSKLYESAVEHFAQTANLKLDEEDF
jgi:DNA polymerase-3 subunit gamma/tau